MREYLRANFPVRRVLALLVSLVCFGTCAAVVLGSLHMGLWQVVVILAVGLLAYEWAG